MSYNNTPKLPSIVGTDYSQEAVNTYLAGMHAENKNAGFGVCQYAHGLASAPVNFAYYGGVYSLTQNRIYFVPYSQANQPFWHYIDCSTGSVVEYAHGTSVVANAYSGGVYSPTQNRIYMIPTAQANSTPWHYIDCSTGAVVPYTHGATAVANAYRGGVYSPFQNRIYMIPRAQALQATWHYINCSTGAVVPYSHGQANIDSAFSYEGGVYSPTQNRIYMVPYAQADNPSWWHYIDCNTGNVVSYLHGLPVRPLDSAYAGGAYSPIQDRIYFSPHKQATQSLWHYINCRTGAVEAYPPGIAALDNAYRTMAYSPTTNRMFLCPNGQGGEDTWHYIDCFSSSASGYPSGGGAILSAYAGCVYSPLNSRMYLIPFTIAPQDSWHYIQEFTAPSASPALMSSTLFNKL